MTSTIVSVISTINTARNFWVIQIESLWAFSQSVWNHRNQIVHGATREEAHELLTQRIDSKIRQAYTCQTDLSPADRRIIFSRLLDCRLQQPLNTKVHWYSLYQHLLHAPSASTTPLPPSQELHSFFRPFAHLPRHPLPQSSTIPQPSITSTSTPTSQPPPHSLPSHNPP